MEQIGAISGGEWNSFNGMCSEEADFMAQLLGNCSLPDEVQSDINFPVSSSFWLSNGNVADVDQSTMYSSDGASTFMYSFSQGSSYESYFPSVSHHVFVANNDLRTMEYSVEDKNNGCLVHIPPSHNVMGGDNMLNQEVSNDSIESENNMSEDVLQGKKMESKKRSRIPGEIQRNKRSVKANKCPKIDESEEANNNNAVVFQRQNSNSYCSEDDSNASHEINGVTCSSSSKDSRALSLAGKTRANRGSATDPQSLYARKRRERINERLRILQKLVPNGTKVDISTMLEEAVQYVKFLQLQIKLLSSDDMWMYAPLAYNGMDIGLDLKISIPKPQS